MIFQAVVNSWSAVNDGKPNMAPFMVGSPDGDDSRVAGIYVPALRLGRHGATVAMSAYAWTESRPTND